MLTLPHVWASSVKRPAKQANGLNLRGCVSQYLSFRLRCQQIGHVPQNPCVKMSSQVWSRSRGVLILSRLPVPVSTTYRHVTDIEYYKEVDQSHLHLVEAQSTKRKFLLKLRAREAWEEQRQKRLIERENRTPWEAEETLTDQPSVAGYTPLPVRETTVYDRLLATAKEKEECVPQSYKGKKNYNAWRDACVIAPKG